MLVFHGVGYSLFSSSKTCRNFYCCGVKDFVWKIIPYLQLLFWMEIERNTTKINIVTVLRLIMYFYFKKLWCFEKLKHVKLDIRPYYNNSNNSWSLSAIESWMVSINQSIEFLLLNQIFFENGINLSLKLLKTKILSDWL
jgi:hypothetical protein